MLNAVGEINTHAASLSKVAKTRNIYCYLIITCNGINDITRLQFFIKQNEISQRL